eukprot:CAMPEP_0201582158 /NCGR_PEP_ID=MMETSP0190_2-20130828/81071_1 /ASSEMBLY_ACC=CAM_ASM_000263 /TAXON_ID=37353 /ORGANISM="Rosalina sp." /LENGTH=157 /DNA_ID=CAMNT_0048021523 /DNA_START=201 /DNA_END=671 /DNA_ORIENTATION=-
MRTKAIKQKKRERKSTNESNIRKHASLSLPNRIRNRLSIGNHGESDHEPGSMFRVESLSHGGDNPEDNDNDVIKVFEPQAPPPMPNRLISHLDIDINPSNRSGNSSNMERVISASPDPPSEFRSRSYKVRHYANPDAPNKFGLDHRGGDGMPPPPRK